jgi:hypothetical protein
MSRAHQRAAEVLREYAAMIEESEVNRSGPLKGRCDPKIEAEIIEYRALAAALEAAWVVLLRVTPTSRWCAYGPATHRTEGDRVQAAQRRRRHGARDRAADPAPGRRRETGRRAQAMTQVLVVFAATFISVFTLGLQSLNVNGRHYLAAACTSLFIGGGHLLLYRFMPSAAAPEILSYLVGGVTGITSSIWCHDRAKAWLQKRRDARAMVVHVHRRSSRDRRARRRPELRRPAAHSVNQGSIHHARRDPRRTEEARPELARPDRRAPRHRGHEARLSLQGAARGRHDQGHRLDQHARLALPDQDLAAPAPPQPRERTKRRKAKHAKRPRP